MVATSIAVKALFVFDPPTQLQTTQCGIGLLWWTPNLCKGVCTPEEVMLQHLKFAPSLTSVVRLVTVPFMHPVETSASWAESCLVYILTAVP